MLRQNFAIIYLVDTTEVPDFTKVLYIFTGETKSELIVSIDVRALRSLYTHVLLPE